MTNPGPDTFIEGFTLADFKAGSDLGIIHIHSLSLLSKLKITQIWSDSTNADIAVSETWLKQSV